MEAFENLDRREAQARARARQAVEDDKPVLAWVECHEVATKLVVVGHV